MLFCWNAPAGQMWIHFWHPLMILLRQLLANELSLFLGKIGLSVAHYMLENIKWKFFSSLCFYSDFPSFVKKRLDVLIMNICSLSLCAKSIYNFLEEIYLYVLIINPLENHIWKKFLEEWACLFIQLAGLFYLLCLFCI